MRKDLLYGLVAMHLALVAWAGTVGRGPEAWGLHAWGYLSVPMLIVLVLGAAGAAAAVLRGWPFPERRARVVILAAAAAVVLFVFRDRAHLLGDGQLWISVLRKNPVFHSNEPLAFALPWLLTRGATDTVGAFVLRLELWSVTLGVAATVIAARIALHSAPDPRERWFTFFFLMGPGFLQFGFGYVEAYPALWVAVLFYIWAMLRTVDTGKGWGILGLALGLAVAVHSMGLLLAVPTLYLFIRQRPPLPEIGVLIGIALFPAVFAYGFLPYVMPSAAGIAAGMGNVLAGAGNIVEGMQFFPHGPVAWLQDQLNRWSLVAPLMLGLIAVAAIEGEFKDTPESSRGQPTRARVLAAAAFMLMLPALVLDTEGARGASADWDAFAVAGVPLAALAAVLWAPRLRSDAGLRYPLAAATFFVVATGFAFVLVNASETAGPRRLEALATSSVWTRNARGLAYESLATHHRDRGDTTRAATMYAKATEFQAGNIRLLRNTAMTLFSTGRYAEAVEAYRLVLDKDDRDPMDWVNYAAVLTQTGKPEEARLALQNALDLDDRNVDALNQLGRLLLMSPVDRDEVERAYGYLKRSLEIAPGQPYAEGIRKTLERLEGEGIGGG
jgi:tetratricopeptide (TPR) repeat protein